MAAANDFKICSIPNCTAVVLNEFKHNLEKHSDTLTEDGRRIFEKESRRREIELLRKQVKVQQLTSNSVNQHSKPAPLTPGKFGEKFRKQRHKSPVSRFYHTLNSFHNNGLRSKSTAIEYPTSTNHSQETLTIKDSRTITYRTQSSSTTNIKSSSKSTMTDCQSRKHWCKNVDEDRLFFTPTTTDSRTRNYQEQKSSNAGLSSKSDYRSATKNGNTLNGMPSSHKRQYSTNFIDHDPCPAISLKKSKNWTKKASATYSGTWPSPREFIDCDGLQTGNEIDLTLLDETSNNNDIITNIKPELEEEEALFDFELSSNTSTPQVLRNSPKLEQSDCLIIPVVQVNCNNVKQELTVTSISDSEVSADCNHVYKPSDSVAKSDDLQSIFSSAPVSPQFSNDAVSASYVPDASVAAINNTNILCVDRPSSQVHDLNQTVPLSVFGHVSERVRPAGETLILSCSRYGNGTEHCPPGDPQTHPTFVFTQIPLPNANPNTAPAVPINSESLSSFHGDAEQSAPFSNVETKLITSLVTSNETTMNSSSAVTANNPAMSSTISNVIRSDSDASCIINDSAKQHLHANLFSVSTVSKSIETNICASPTGPDLNTFTDNTSSPTPTTEPSVALTRVELGYRFLLCPSTMTLLGLCCISPTSVTLDTALKIQRVLVTLLYLKKSQFCSIVSLRVCDIMVHQDRSDSHVQLKPNNGNDSMAITVNISELRYLRNFIENIRPVINSNPYTSAFSADDCFSSHEQFRIMIDNMWNKFENEVSSLSLWNCLKTNTSLPADSSKS